MRTEGALVVSLMVAGMRKGHMDVKLQLAQIGQELEEATTKVEPRKLVTV